jgi:threonine synthase
VVVISTAHGLKFAEQKAAYHMGKLDGVQPRDPNLPVEVPPDVDTVQAAIQRHVEWVGRDTGSLPPS